METTKKMNMGKRAAQTLKKGSVAFFMLISNVIVAFPVFAEEGKNPSAKGFTSWVLSDWVAPLFAFGVVCFVIRAISNQKWLQMVALIIGGAIVYFFIDDPQGFLDRLSGIPVKFGF